MIEKMLTTIINELGATGVLVVGLYFILYKPMKKISSSLETMNHNSAKLINCLDNLNTGIKELKK